MNPEKLIENIVDQIKEAQIKLGYAKETVRLYYPAESLCRWLGLEAMGDEELAAFLSEEPAFSDTVLGKLQFAAHKGRIEARIPPEGVQYVHQQAPAPEFLKDLIGFFGEHPHCRLEEVCEIFAKYSKDYVCEKMPEGADFDYVLYFPDESVDAYYYCVKEEMGHTIYHRFIKEDYQALL